MVCRTPASLRWSASLALALAAIAPNSDAQKNQQQKGAGSTPSASPASQPQSSGSSTAPFEVEMLSYGALDQVLSKLAGYTCQQLINGDAKAGPFRRVVVLDSPTLQNLQAFDAFSINAQALVSAFKAMTGKAGAGGGGSIDIFADITGAVATLATATTSESASSFAIQDPSAAVAFIRNLRSGGTTGCQQAFYAGVYTVDEAQGGQAGAGNPDANANTMLVSTGDALNTLASTRAAALKAVIGQGAAPDPAVPCVGTKTAATPATAGPVYAVSSQDPCVVAFNNLDATYNAFLAGLSNPNATTGQPALASIIQGYRLRALLNSGTDESPILAVYLSVAAAGGTQRDRKNIITALFTGDLISYSGGVSVNVIVFQIGGKHSQILFSDLLRYRTPFERIADPGGDGKTPRAGDNLDDLSKK